MKLLRTSLLGLCLLLNFGPGVRGDSNVLPGGAFDSSRYHSLWEESPFAVATPVAVESVEYSLVGAAQFDGIAYASVIDKQSQEHFVVTSSTPSHGLTLVNLIRGQDVASTFANLQKNGGMLKLKLETTASPGSMPIPSSVSVVAVPTAPQVLYSSGARRGPPRARIFTPPVFIPRPPPNSP